MKTNKHKSPGTVRKVLSLAHRIVPGYITFVLIVRLIAAGQPFVSIYFSSLILDGLFRMDSFEKKYIDGYCGYIEFGKGENLVGIIGHLDVVPSGDGWETLPFEATIKDR